MAGRKIEWARAGVTGQVPSEVIRVRTGTAEGIWGEPELLAAASPSGVCAGFIF